MNNQSSPDSRRTFCKAMLYVAASASLVSGCTDSPANHEELTRYLVMQISHHETAESIGKMYLQIDPQLRSLSADQVADAILERLGVKPGDLSAISLQDVGQRLTSRVHQDFAEETVVTVDGWLLSQTEARLCALVYRYRHPSS